MSASPPIYPNRERLIIILGHMQRVKDTIEGRGYHLTIGMRMGIPGPLSSHEELHNIHSTSAWREMQRKTPKDYRITYNSLHALPLSMIRKGYS
jgi:hypothetical protein